MEEYTLIYDFYDDRGTATVISIQSESEADLEVKISNTVKHKGKTYTVTGIDISAFRNCKNLVSITIPDSVTSIGERAFDGCTSLENITIGNSVTSIGDYAFYNCTSLTSITIPDSVTSIGYWAFYKCTSLTSVTIPNSVTNINNGAFLGCTGLTSITIPDSVTSIGGRAFEDCTSLSAVYYTGTMEDWDKISGNGNVPSVCYYYAETKPAIAGNYWHYVNGIPTPWFGALKYKKNSDGASYSVSGIDNCTGDVIIPETWNGLPVTSIGDYAFYNCTSLTSITIGNSVTSIGSYAFQNCKKLSNVALGEGVKEIETGAFSDCESLATITIPKSVETIGVYAFGGSGLTATIVEKDSLTNCFWYCIDENDEQIKMSCLTEDISGNVLSTGFCRNYILKRKKYKEDSISKLTYNKIIGAEEYEITDIKQEGEIILVPEKYENCPITRIAKDAFRILEGDEEKATSIIIAAKVKEIGEWAFGQRKKIKSITLNYGLETLESSVFFGCTNLSSIFLPPTIEEIGTQLFYWNTGLEKIVVHENNKKYSSIDNCLLNIDKTELVYGCKNSIIPSTVTIIRQGAFYGQNYKETEFKIPNNITKIETLGIGFQNVSDIYLPHSLETIHNNAFYNCMGLKNIYYNIKNAKLVDVKNSPIEHSPFCWSDEMTPPNGINIYIGGSVEAIPPYMFKCNKQEHKEINFRINSINIGWGIEEIADDVFGDMVEPREVLLPSSVTKIGANSFSKDVTLKQDKKYAEDFVGFTYNGYHSIRDLNIYRTSDGSRYNENLTATMTDKTADVPGGDGQYYFGTQFKNRTFNISYAFDSLSESGLARLKEVFRGDGVHDLIFDETPYKVWSAKVTGTAQIKHICFEENGERRYKGEGSITFTCYYPFAHTPKIESQISPESVHMMAIDRWIPTNMLIQKNGQIKNLLKVSIKIKYNPQIGDSWGKEEIKEISFEDQIEDYTVSSTHKVLITAIMLIPAEGQAVAENSIKILPTDGVTMDCPFSYTSRGCFERLPAQGGGRDINSYSIYDYPNKKEWMLSTNMITTPYDNFEQNKGAVNYGQLPAPFRLEIGEITFSETEVNIKNESSPLYGKKLTNQTLQIGDNVITITSTPTKYKIFVWDSKTGIVKAEDSLGNNIYLSYTGNSIGTIPPNTSGVTIFFPDNAKLEYDYWYY